jgi:hypothetical protein
MRMGRHRRHGWSGAAETRRGFIAVTALSYRKECQKRELQEQMRAVGESTHAPHEARTAPTIVSSAR